jgi:glc operon protein GlcG
MKKISLILSLVALFSFPAFAQLADKKVLTLEAARKITAAAEAEARKNGWTMAIAVVDDAGHLITFVRIDGTQTGSIEVAVAKAKTAAAFKRPSKFFEEAIKTRPALATLSPSAVMVEGGVPVFIGQQLLGAVGVSGGSSQQDGVVAEAGIAALELK